MKTFHICTIANNLSLYEDMKRSFISSGFDEDKCRYSLFDNSQGNTFDPYQTFNWIHANTSEPYIIFCHQDLLMNQGDNFQDLVNCLEELNKIDPRWAVVGNAGVNNCFQGVFRITHPPHVPDFNWRGDFPQKVHSLDENFLVIKSAANLKCTSELSGFHFYATDLCLNAIIMGYSCYVINFNLTHLSTGKYDDYFYQVKSQFETYWSKKLNFCYLKTITAQTMFLSKHKLIRYIFTQKDVQKWCLSRPKLMRFFTVYHF